MMNVTLSGAKHSRWQGDLLQWMELLHFAKTYGWKPTGCPDESVSEDKNWIVNYEMPLGQTVAAADASAFAAALRRGLRCTPSLITGEARATVRNLIQFCTQGAFEITPK
jgi:hypothetical protein